MNKAVPGILFICTHNACRSILAEVVTRTLAGPRLRVASAGSDPAGRVHPLTLQYLEKNKYSSKGLCSKSLDDIEQFKPDIVVTVCDSAARESCPLWLDNAIKVHWGLVDPTAIEGGRAATERAFDRVVRIVEARVRALLAQAFESQDKKQLEALLKHITESSLTAL